MGGIKKRMLPSHWSPPRRISAPGRGVIEWDDLQVRVLASDAQALLETLSLLLGPANEVGGVCLSCGATTPRQGVNSAVATSDYRQLTAKLCQQTRSPGHARRRCESHERLSQVRYCIWS